MDNKKVLAVCDGCGRDIMEDEVAWFTYGIHCFDCCKIIWDHGIEYLEKLNSEQGDAECDTTEADQGGDAGNQNQRNKINEYGKEAIFFIR